MNCNKNKNKVDLKLFDGNFLNYDQNTKNKFYNDFVYNKVYRNGKRISAGSTDIEIEKCYEHLTSCGSMDSSVRLPDLRRYESIYILKNLLEDEDCVKCKNYFVWKKFVY